MHGEGMQGEDPMRRCHEGFKDLNVKLNTGYW
jgi:hypothetical protein